MGPCWVDMSMQIGAELIFLQLEGTIFSMILSVHFDVQLTSQGESSTQRAAIQARVILLYISCLNHSVINSSIMKREPPRDYKHEFPSWQRLSQLFKPFAL